MVPTPGDDCTAVIGRQPVVVTRDDDGRRAFPSVRASTSVGSAPLPPPVLIRNEFAMVEVSYVRRGHSLSLVVTDSATGSRIVLDATDLEALAQASHESFRKLLRESDAHHDRAQ